MIFWWCFFLTVIFGGIIGLICRDYQSERIAYIILIAIFIIGGFRYMIGTDYNTYYNIYNFNNLRDIVDVFCSNNDLLFSLVVYFFNEMGFSAQMMFVFYEFIIVLFLFLGGKYYLNGNGKKIVVFTVIFTVFTGAGGYLWGFNAIRQAAAVMIGFYGSQYLEKKEWCKFSITFIFAFITHSTAVLMLPLIFFKNRTVSITKLFLMLMISFVINLTGVSGKIFIYVVGIYSQYAVAYDTSIPLSMSMNSYIPISTLLLVILYVISIFIVKRSKAFFVDYFMQISTLYICIRVLMSFGLENSLIQSLLHRVEAYYLPFYICLLVIFVFEIQKYLCGKYTTIMIFLFISIMFSLGTINKMEEAQNDPQNLINDSYSAGNFEYEFNMKIFK